MGTLVLSPKFPPLPGSECWPILSFPGGASLVCVHMCMHVCMSCVCLSVRPTIISKRPFSCDLCCLLNGPLPYLEKREPSLGSQALVPGLPVFPRH